MSSDPVSKLLQVLILLAKEVNDSECERWAKLETNGYHKDNPALLEGDKIPSYRNVVGYYVDRFGRTVTVNQPELHFILEYALPTSAAELESLIAGRSSYLSVPDHRRFAFINKQFESEVVDFRFSRTSVETVLASIRTNVIERVDTVKRNLPNTEQPKPSALVLSAFHPKVIEVAGKLFDDGHFRQTILDTYIALEEYVRAKTGASGFGTNLMQSVFSVNNPIIKVSDDQDEQKGFMWLFTGASMGIRNPKAHKVIPQTDPQRTLEWLAFASVLFRVVDDSLALNNSGANP